MPNKTSHEVKRFMILISEEKLQSYLIDKQFRIVRHVPYAGELLTTIDGYEDIITTGILHDLPSTFGTSTTSAGTNEQQV